MDINSLVVISIADCIFFIFIFGLLKHPRSLVYHCGSPAFGLNRRRRPIKASSCVALSSLCNVAGGLVKVPCMSTMSIKRQESNGQPNPSVAIGVSLNIY